MGLATYQRLTMGSSLFPCSALLLSVLITLPTTSDATIAIAVASGTTTLLSLTAAQVTGLAALKLLGVSAGVLLSRRGKREEPSNKVKIDSDVENIHKVVTSKPGKYRTAHKFGQSGAVCSLRYKCSMKVEDIIQFYQSY